VPAKKPMSAFLCEKRDKGVKRIKTMIIILVKDPGKDGLLS